MESVGIEIKMCPGIHKLFESQATIGTQAMLYFIRRLSLRFGFGAAGRTSAS